ncbi:MAG: GyrI-like domain-containing protein [Anaerolineae bacterium]
MEVQIVSKAAFTVVGVKYRGKNENHEIPQLWDKEYLPRMAEIMHRSELNVSYGLMGNYDPKSGEYDYVAGAEVSDATDIPQGMVIWQVLAQAYAVYPCILLEIGAAWDYMYQTWLPNSSYQHADAPDFEYYGAEFTTSTDPAKARMYLYVPVVPRTSRV